MICSSIPLLQDDDEDVRDVVNGMLVGACAGNTDTVTVPAGYPTTEVNIMGLVVYALGKPLKHSIAYFFLTFHTLLIFLNAAGVLHGSAVCHHFLSSAHLSVAPL